MNDEVLVEGLAILLDDDAMPPYLELTLRSGGQTFQAAILAAEEDWALRVRDEWGKSCAGGGELYPTQSAAILAAMLIALETGRNPDLP